MKDVTTRVNAAPRIRPTATSRTLSCRAKSEKESMKRLAFRVTRSSPWRSDCRVSSREGMVGDWV